MSSAADPPSPVQGEGGPAVRPGRERGQSGADSLTPLPAHSVRHPPPERGRARLTPARLGAIIVFATLALDQATKLYLLFGLVLTLHEPLVLAPFLELIVVWNRGISYGLFQQHGDVGRWVLVGLSLAAACGLTLWMVRTPHRLLAAALALIVGGALGNAVDRLAYGAVFDFVHLHAGPYSWYVFNVADAAIVAGVVGLLVDGLVFEPRRLRRAKA